MKNLLIALVAVSTVSMSPAFGAAITDVTYEGQDADAVAGPFPGSDDVAGVNTLGGAFAGTPWALLDKSDEGSPGDEFMGVTFTLLADNTTSDGDWSLSWVETGLPGLPLTMDFVFVAKAAEDWAAYLFEAINFTDDPTSGNGTFLITWLNGGGQAPELSHASVYARAAEAPPPVDVPEPSLLMLLGLGLFGLVMVSRAKAQSSI